MRWAEHIARMRAKRNAYSKMMEKLERKRPLGTPGRKWVDRRETGWSVMLAIGLAKDMNRWRPLVNTAMNTRIP
jgi:hypothetical protein